MIDIYGGRKLFEKSFPSPIPLSFKNFQTRGYFRFTKYVRLLYVLCVFTKLSRMSAPTEKMRDNN